MAYKKFSKIHDPDQSDPARKTDITSDNTYDTVLNPTETQRCEQSSPREGGRENDNMIDRKKWIPMPPNSVTKEYLPPDDVKPPLHTSDLIYKRKFGIPLPHSITVMISFLFSALILFIVFSNLLSIYHDIIILPSLIKWISFVILAVLGGFIVYSVLKLILYLFRLSKTPQLSIEQLVNIGTYDNRAYRMAKDIFLEKYLREYLEHFNKASDWFREQDEIIQLQAAAKILLEPDRRITSRAWFEEFMDRIQKPMESMAEHSVAKYSKLVGIKTAISPWPFIDIIAVIYNTVKMLKELAEIFNRRLNYVDTVTLLFDIFVSVFVAGQTQEAIDSIHSELGNNLTSSSVSVGEDSAQDIANPLIVTAFENLGSSVISFAKASSKKFAEGAANWFLMRRLGKRLVKILKPIA